MSNKAIFFIVWSVFFIVSAFTLNTAIANAEWRSFLVTEFHLLLVASALSYLLRMPPSD